MIHPCNEQTDGQTDGRAIAKLRICYMLSRTKTSSSSRSQSYLTTEGLMRYTGYLWTWKIVLGLKGLFLLNITAVI